jgi:pyruvate ferredoxin oxidoreductase alpha subunit
MAMRETGWVMLLGESVQEAYDNALMAVRIAEHPKVRLPVASCLDGFTVTHSVERVDLLSDADAAAFVYEPVMKDALLAPGAAMTHGTMDFHDFGFEHRRQNIAAMDAALRVAEEVGRAFEEVSGRRYPLLDLYRMEDATVAVVVMGSAAGTVRTVIDGLRADGHKAGMVRVRCFRPFPVEQLAEALRDMQHVGVLDRAVAPGSPGNPLYLDVVSALAQRGVAAKTTPYVYGLGGRNTPAPVFRDALLNLARGTASASVTSYLGLREGAR